MKSNSDGNSGNGHSSYLSFNDVSYEVDGRSILEHLSFELSPGQTLVLLGRSGSGKTTALRLINRTLDATSGEIELDGINICDTDPISLRRGIGYVIQEVGLLPHWSIEENVGLVPKLKGISPEHSRERVHALLEQVGLPPSEYATRYPHQLSGGQRQRAGVARALAAEPKLLLFDEPFGALDPVTRHEMQQQFLELRTRYNVASVFVTHDIGEALILGTQIALLDQGELKVLASNEDFQNSDNDLAKAFLNTLPDLRHD